jgi:hypothetical protein
LPISIQVFWREFCEEFLEARNKALARQSRFGKNVTIGLYVGWAILLLIFFLWSVA